MPLEGEALVRAGAPSQEVGVRSVACEVATVLFDAHSVATRGRKLSAAARGVDQGSVLGGIRTKFALLEQLPYRLVQIFGCAIGVAPLAECKDIARGALGEYEQTAGTQPMHRVNIRSPAKAQCCGRS